MEGRGGFLQQRCKPKEVKVCSKSESLAFFWQCGLRKKTLFPHPFPAVLIFPHHSTSFSGFWHGSGAYYFPWHVRLKYVCSWCALCCPNRTNFHGLKAFSLQVAEASASASVLWPCEKVYNCMHQPTDRPTDCLTVARGFHNKCGKMECVCASEKMTKKERIGIKRERERKECLKNWSWKREK